jgi:hypothetical protein
VRNCYAAAHAVRGGKTEKRHERSFDQKKKKKNGMKEL